MTISAITRLVRTTSKFSQHYLHCSRNGPPKFQSIMVSSFGITSLDSRKSKEIDLYSNYTKNILQMLTFTVITSVWISLQVWDLAYNVHHGLADRPRFSFCLAVTSA